MEAWRRRGGWPMAGALAATWGRRVGVTLAWCSSRSVGSIPLRYSGARGTERGPLRRGGTLDGALWLAQREPEEWDAIRWLNTHVAGRPFILETPGDRYRAYVYEGRVSALTGLPTLLGWGGHQSQWRGNYDEPAVREAALERLFTPPTWPRRAPCWRNTTSPISTSGR